MLIKKFIAPSLPEALTKVKEDFGDEAVILKTRFNNKSNNPGKDSRFVEVTAAIDQAEKTIAPRKSPEPVRIAPVNERLKAAVPRQVAKPPVKEEKPATGADFKTPSEILNELRKDINMIKSDLASSRKESFFGQPIGIQLEAGRMLMEKHLPESLVIDILKANPCAPDRKTEDFWKSLSADLVKKLGPGEPIKIVENGATVVMLIGPTGSGKSSAAARLAFQFTIEDKAPVSLITTDNFRADSREQLMALANVIGCSFASVSSPEELTVLLKTFKTGLVIIDTSGYSTRKDVEELASLIGAANPHEIHMVIPADTPAGDLIAFLNDNPGIDIDRLFVTKLDQSRYRGGVIGAAAQRGLKFSYQCASRELPGNLELFDPATFISGVTPTFSKPVTRKTLEEVKA